MTETWRYIDAGPMDAPTSFGRMPIVAASVVNGGPEVLMTSLWSRAHFQIGWFEDVDAVMDLGEAERRGVDVFRRPIWGGGTAFYDTNATATLSWFIRDEHFATLDDALRHFAPVMERVLADLGLGEASFQGSSDIRWRGRKLGTLITQNVLGTKIVGGFFNLRRPDLEVYAAIARVPEEKFKDKIIKDQVAYICTPADVRGSDLPYEEFRDAVLTATRDIAGLTLDRRPFTAEEDASVDGFVTTVRDGSWIRRISSERFREDTPAGARVGLANLKAKKLIRAGVALDDAGTIIKALMAGDMHISPPDAMDRVAAGLEGANVADRDGIVGRVREVFEQPDVSQPDETAGITAEDCAEAVLLAAKNAG